MFPRFGRHHSHADHCVFVQLTTGQDPDSKSNLYFSLSTTTLKLFTSLTVVAGGSAVVYLHFQPEKEDNPVLEFPICKRETHRHVGFTHTVNNTDLHCFVQT